MIVRSKHKGNYTKIPNAILEDSRLSIETKGALCYLLSRHPDWQVHGSQLQHALRIGRDKLARIQRELMDTGYMTRDGRQPRTGGNRFDRLDYVVWDIPQIGVANAPPSFDINVANAPQTEIPSAEIRPPETSTHTNNLSILSTEIITPLPPEAHNADRQQAGGQEADTQHRVHPFSDFRTAYPFQAWMSALKATRLWERLSSGDRTDAITGAELYAQDCIQQHRKVKDAARWLSDRVWEGYCLAGRPLPASGLKGKSIVGSDSCPPDYVGVIEGSPAYDAWIKYHCSRKMIAPFVRTIVVNGKSERGFYMPTEFPP